MTVLSDDVKAKLQEMLHLLHQDIGQLVRNAKPIRTILEGLERQLPESIEEALTPAAYIESHRVQFSELKSNLPIAFNTKILPDKRTIPKLSQN